MQADERSNPAIVDVTDESFEREVIARSHQQPVVVDFWAPWCGPCRMLGPILERLAEEGGGAWRLAKLDTEQHQRVAGGFGITSIPAVKAFVDGKVVDEFVGVLPEPQIRSFLEGLLPSAADELAQEGQRLAEAGDRDAALARFREALAEEESHPAAALGAGRILVDRADYVEALDCLAKVPRGSAEWQAAEQLQAQARFRQEAGLSEREIELRHRLAENPEDAGTRVLLARSLAARERYREALEGLLQVVRSKPGAERDAAQAAMLEVFTALGDEDPLCQEYRPLLAAALW